MLRLNKLTDYAVVILARMAAEPGRNFSASHLAERTAVPEPTAAKVLKDLARTGLVASARGSTGGYSLTRGGDTITVREVIEAVEGPIGLVECMDPESKCCTTQKKCPLRGKWEPVNAAVAAALGNVTLADMMGADKKEIYTIVIPAKAGIHETVQENGSDA